MTIVRTRTPAGEAIVILSEAEFERLRDLAEDASDARILEASRARLDGGGEDLLSEDDLDALRAAPSPLVFWRERRGVSRSALARDSGVPCEIIASLESATATAESGVYARLARALGIDAEDIEPATS